MNEHFKYKSWRINAEAKGRYAVTLLWLFLVLSRVLPLGMAVPAYYWLQDPALLSSV